MWSPFLCDINRVTFYLLHLAALLSSPELEADQRAGLEVTIDWAELFRLSALPTSLPQDGDDPLQELHLRQVTAIRGISDVAPLQTDIRYIRVPGFYQFCILRRLIRHLLVTFLISCVTTLWLRKVRR